MLIYFYFDPNLSCSIFGSNLFHVLNVVFVLMLHLALFRTQLRLDRQGEGISRENGWMTFHSYSFSILYSGLLR